jgi:transposase
MKTTAMSQVSGAGRMLTERLRVLVRQIEQLPPAEQDVLAGVLQHELDAHQGRQQGVAALERLAQFRAELRHAGYPSVDAVALVRAGRAEAVARQAG